MFVITLTYKKPLADVEQHLAAHIAYLDEYYAKGTFIASGRKVPRTGGVILAKANGRAELEAIVKLDPFYIEEVVEFVPTRAAAGLEALIEQI